MPEVFDNSDLFNSVFNIEESEKLEETESIINQVHHNTPLLGPSYIVYWGPLCWDD